MYDGSNGFAHTNVAPWKRVNYIIQRVGTTAHSPKEKSANNTYFHRFRRCPSAREMNWLTVRIQMTNLVGEFNETPENAQIRHEKNLVASHHMSD